MFVGRGQGGAEYRDGNGIDEHTSNRKSQRDHEHEQGNLLKGDGTVTSHAGLDAPPSADEVYLDSLPC